MLKKLSFILVFTLGFPVLSFSNPLEKFVQQLETYAADPSLVNIDYTLHQYKRTPEKERVLINYRSGIMYSRSLIPKVFQYMFQDKINENMESIESILPLTPEKCLPAFQALLKKGETLKTGDVVFISSLTGYSITSRQFADIEYSHTALIWIKNNIPYTIQIHPQADFLILPLIDFLFPKEPQNFAFGIYRYKEDYDILEMDYLFQIMERNKDRLLFDDYFINNNPIDDPETYFQKNSFIYCTELPYLCYAYILNKNNFISSFRFNSKKLLKQFMHTSTLIDIGLDVLDNHDHKKNFIVVSRHFTESPYFGTLVEFKKEKRTK